MQAHLGYRYLIRSCKLKKSVWINPKLALTLTLENNGFSNTLKPFETTILFKNVSAFLLRDARHALA